MKNLPVVAAAFALISFLLVGCASPTPAPSAAQPSGFEKALALETPALAEVLSPAVSATGDGLEVTSADGSQTRTLPSGLDRTGLALAAAARGLSTEAGALRWEWLATLSRDSVAELSVLSIHDTDGRLVHEEVLAEACTRVAWHEGDAPELRLECPIQSWRYRPGSGGEPALSAEEFVRSGNAFGPLSFGDSRARATAALALAGGGCSSEECVLWPLRLDERSYVLAPGFEGGRLARVTVFGPRRGRAEWRTRVRADWNALTSDVGRGAGTASVGFPPLRALKASAKLDGWLLTETHHVQSPGALATVGLYGDRDGKSVGAIAAILPAVAEGTLPASAAD